MFDQIVEKHIQRAQIDGEFDNLPGVGRPLKLDDDLHIPEELRPAYRLLKNAGFVPEEVLLRKQISDVKQLIATSTDVDIKSSTGKRLNALLTQLEIKRGAVSPLATDPVYKQKLVNKP